MPIQIYHTNYQMYKLRVNTENNFSWKILLGEKEVDWSYFDLTLEMTKPSHGKEILDITIDGSTVNFSYKPNQVGQYIISAYLNRYKSSEAALDMKIFEAVKWSWNTSYNNTDNLDVEALTLVGNMSVGTGSMIAPEDYYTKEQIDIKFESVITDDNIHNFNFATEEWVSANYQPKANYLTEIPSEYITESELETRLEGLDIGSGNVDLTGYATEDWTASKFQPIGDYLTSIPAQYVTEKELANRGYITEEEVDAKGFITSIPAQYVTESELAKKKYVTQDDLTFGDFNLDGYYTKFEADELFVQKGEVNMDDYATIYQLAMKQDKLDSGSNIKTINGIDILGEGDIMIAAGEAPDMSGYVTAVELNNKGFITSIPKEYITEEDLNGRNYATVDSVEAKQDVLVVGQNIKTINGKSILGAGNIQINANAEVDLSGYYTKSEIDDIVSNIDTGGEAPDLTGYATEQWVKDKYVPKSTYSIDLQQNRLLAKLDAVSWVTEQGYLSEIPSEYVTETELETRLEGINPGTIDEIPTLTIDFETGEYNDRFLVETIFQRLLSNKPCNIVLLSDEVEGEKGPIYTMTDVNSYQFQLDNTACVLSFDVVGKSWYSVTMFREASLETPSAEHYKVAQISINTETCYTEVNNLKTTVANKVTGDGISTIKKMTQAEYDAITPDANTLYIIVE